MEGINDAWGKVREFHRAFNHPAPDRPQGQDADKVARRANWIDSEVQELRDAPELVDQADAYIDIIYFALGGLVELGVPPGALFDIVHGANMAKLHNGVPVYHPDGKTMKPKGWQAPEPQLRMVIESMLTGNPGEPHEPHRG